MKKAWWKSKTVWANILGGVAEGGQLLMDTRIVPTGTITIVLAAVNIALRRITTQPIGATDQP